MWLSPSCVSVSNVSFPTILVFGTRLIESEADIRMCLRVIRLYVWRCSSSRLNGAPQPLQVAGGAELSAPYHETCHRAVATMQIVNTTQLHQR